MDNVIRINVGHTSEANVRYRVEMLAMSLRRNNKFRRVVAVASDGSIVATAECRGRDIAATVTYHGPKTEAK